jgi:Tfp pilus assembly protein PilN
MATTQPVKTITRINALTEKPIGAIDKDDLPGGLPQEEQPQRWSRKTIALWLVMASVTVFFLPLYTISLAVQDDTSALKSDLASIQKSLTAVPTAIPAVAQILTPLAKTQAQVNQVSTVYPTVVATRQNWSSVMETIGGYDPNKIVLLSIGRSENRISLGGQAVNDAEVVAYAHALEQSPLVSRVIVQSIQLMTTTNNITTTVVASKVTATPTRSSTVVASAVASSAKPVTGATVKPYSAGYIVAPPGSSSASVVAATPDLRDSFEPDDARPSSIALSQAQLHTFYPANDIDTATFLAKSKHWYRVYTTALAPGVDTLLNVQAGGASFNNDDAHPGSLYSEIIFQNLGSDVMALITAYNRGQFGSDKSYQLIVEDTVVQPTSTPTAQPTHTLIPSPTATADLRDIYEPDATTPKPIAIGETQLHNFYPANDIDKVSFLVKSGRYYQVLTSDLVLGVDTIVTVTLNSSQWMNDDYAPKGSGNMASAVCLYASQDGTAVATIINAAKMYAPDKTYRVRVSEVPSLTASPCLPPGTPSAQNNSMRSIAWRTTNTDDPSIASDVALTVRFVLVVELW